MSRRFSRTLVMLSWAAASAACGADAAVTAPTAPVTAPTPVAPITGQAANQSSSTIALTGETLQLYAADQGSAHLSGPGFDLTSASAGSFPQTVAAGGTANFSGPVTLSDWGNVTVNGVALHGDASGPGVGRLWIRGTLTIAAAPFTAPLLAFSGQLETTMTVSGSIAGYANANPGQQALFATAVSGTGTISGLYRAVTAAFGSQFVNTCCVVVRISG
jgi:hypothetical protein